MFHVLPDSDNVEPLVTALNAATTGEASNERGVVLLVPTQGQITASALLAAFDRIGATLEQPVSPTHSWEIMVNNINVTVTYVSNQNVNLAGNVLIVAWPGSATIKKIKPHTDSVIIVKWKNGLSESEGECEVEQYLEQNNSKEIPLEILI